MFKKLFGKKPQKGGDDRGIYMHIACGKCEKVLRIRADKQHDLNRDGGSYFWRKTIVCDKCFHRMHTDVTFDSKYTITSSDIDSGRYVEAPADV